MKVALVTFGSAGDVHPMLALGQSLKQRGHLVTLLTNPVWADLVKQAGLQIQPVGTVADYEQTLAHPKLWHPIDGLGVMWRYLLRPALRPTYEALSQLRTEGLDAVVATPVAFGARLACERGGVPLLSALTAATMLRSTQAPLTIAAWQVPAWMPRWGLQALWNRLDRLKLEPLVRPVLDPLCMELGLPVIEGSVFGEWMLSPDGVLALFPEWFAHAADWPQAVQHAGFMAYEGDKEGGLPAGLADFLDAGPDPLVFAPGTAQRYSNKFYEAAMTACKRLGIRGVLLGQYAPMSSSPEIVSVPYAPLALLLPRARAIVHHGGVGTCAQGLKFALPQGVVPSAYDQFDNAMRLERLGVGASLAMKLVDAERMTRLIKAITENTDMTLACKRWALQMDVGAYRAKAADAVEALLP